jgi:hypothetical protein
MRTNTEELPSIDSSRTHLDILKDTLALLIKNQPTSPVFKRGCETGDLDCGVCGFPLTGAKPGLKHHTYKHHLSNTGGCDWLQCIAELETWIRVEEKLQEEKDESLEDER